MLYETDYSAWAESQAQALKDGRFELLDLPNLAEEVEGLSRTDKRALRSHLEVLLTHLLTWQHQPELRGTSWKVTIQVQRKEIASLLEESPSLKAYLPTVYDDVLVRAYKQAALETGYPKDTFASTVYPLEVALDESYFPGLGV